MIADLSEGISCHEQKLPYDLTGEFTGLHVDDQFTQYMYTSFDSMSVEYRQKGAMRGDSSYMPGLDDVLFFSGSYSIEEARANLVQDGDVQRIDFTFHANGQDYTIESNGGSVALRTTGYDGSALAYTLDGRALVGFLLGLVHINTNSGQKESLALPEGFLELPAFDKSKLALEMLGVTTGFTVKEYIKKIVAEPLDSAYIVRLTEAEGENFDSASVTVDMSWQFVEGLSTLVTLRSNENVSNGHNHHTASGMRVPIDATLRVFPLMQMFGLIGPLDADKARLLLPSENYVEWRNAVNCVMSRLKPIYSAA